MLTPLQLPSVYYDIPPVTDVHVMLKKIESERMIWSAKGSHAKSERHLYLSIKKKIKNVTRPYFNPHETMEKKL